MQLARVRRLAENAAARRPRVAPGRLAAPHATGVGPGRVSPWSPDAGSVQTLDGARRTRDRRSLNCMWALAVRSSMTNRPCSHKVFLTSGERPGWVGPDGRTSTACQRGEGVALPGGAIVHASTALPPPDPHPRGAGCPAPTGPPKPASRSNPSTSRTSGSTTPSTPEPNRRDDGTPSRQRQHRGGRGPAPRPPRVTTPQASPAPPRRGPRPSAPTA